MLSEKQKAEQRISCALEQVHTPKAQKTLRGMQLIEARGASWTPSEFENLLKNLDTLLAKEQCHIERSPEPTKS